jgi:FMN phosphatase YigB (HAD superfamily)
MLDYSFLTPYMRNIQQVSGPRMKINTNQDTFSHASASRTTRPINTLGFSTDCLSPILQKFSTLSLDVFDTIVSRRSIQPTDVFFWMEAHYAIKGFLAARVRAEEDARKQHRRRGAEVSLEEIYDAFSSEIPLPDHIVDLELEAEGRFLFGNPTVLDLIETARALGKRVIAVSDIYLSAAQVEQLLAGVGIVLDKIYTSADFRAENIGKYNATIFDRVARLEDTDPGAIFHVGDNLVSDIVNATSCGVATLWTRNLHDEIATQDSLARFVATRATSPSDRIIAGQINKITACADHPQVAEERIGYSLGGPLILGFLDFIQCCAREQGVGKLVLLERDGCIVSEAARLLSETAIPMRLVPCSRRMAALPCLAKGNSEPLLKLFTTSLSAAEFFDALIIPRPETLDSTDKTLRAAKDHLKAHRAFLVNQAEVELRALESELQDELAMVAAGQKIAWVDVGWALSSASALNTALGIDVPCYCIGSNKSVAPSLAHEGYLYKQNDPSDVSNPINMGPELIELIFSAQMPSTAYLQSDGNRVSRISKTQPTEELIRNIAIAAAHRGVLAFIKDVADISNGLDMVALKDFNRRLARDFCRTPPAALYHMIARIPHDRMPGHQAWATIGHYWQPRTFGDAAEKSQLDELQRQLFKARSKPLRQLYDLLLFKLLRRLSRMSPPLSHRAASRFARSAEKRDPKHVLPR